MAPQPFTAWNAIVKSLTEHGKRSAALRESLAEAESLTAGRITGLADIAPEEQLAAFERTMLGGDGSDSARNKSLYAHLTNKKAPSAPSVAQQNLIRAFLNGQTVTQAEILAAADRKTASAELNRYFKKNDGEIRLPDFLPENDERLKAMRAVVEKLPPLTPASEGAGAGAKDEPKGKGKGKEGAGAKAEPKKPIVEQPKPITPRPEEEEEEKPDTKPDPPVVPAPAPAAPAPAPAPAPAAPKAISLSREDALARGNPDAPMISDGEKAAAKAGAMQNEEAKNMQEMEVGASGAALPKITDASQATQGREQNVDNRNPTGGGESRATYTAEELAKIAQAQVEARQIPINPQIQMEATELSKRIEDDPESYAPEMRAAINEYLKMYDEEISRQQSATDMSQAQGRRAVIRTEASIPTQEPETPRAPAERIAGTGEAGTEAAPVENLVLEDVARDGEGAQGAMISTPAQAMKAAGSDSKDDEKEVAGLSIEEAKRRIRALHQVFDSMIKAFREKPHTKDRDDALNSSDPKKVKAHLLSMLKKVREYYAGSPKGLKVGVIVPMDQLVGAILGRAGMSGIAAPAGPVSGQPIEAGKVSTASADRVHPGEFLHKAKEDRFGRAISLSIHRRNSGMDAYKRRGVRNHSVPVSQTMTPGPVANPKIRVNQNVPFGGVFGGVVQGRNPKSMGIRIKT